MRINALGRCRLTVQRSASVDRRWAPPTARRADRTYPPSSMETMRGFSACLAATTFNRSVAHA